jgi:predicted metal-dependent hydrolase
MLKKPAHPPLPADVQVKRNPRARRLILRLAQRGDGVEVVAPKRASQREIARFVELNNDWIAHHRAARPPQVAFAEGNLIPFRGQSYELARSSSLRGVVKREEGRMIFSCLPEHLPRRVTDYMIREARMALLHSLTRHALTLGVRLPKFTLRDTTTRWGSCSSSGTLSFSWRLIMAPPDVLDYVAAHELAHLKHMDHGRKFWALCERLAPQTDAAKAWLSDNGPALHRYG